MRVLPDFPPDQPPARLRRSAEARRAKAEGGSHNVRRNAWTLVGIAAAAVAVWAAAGSAHPGTVGVTWTTGASRILQNRCVGCHGPGGPAQPRLDEYEPARLASQAIKHAVLSRHLPGWYAAAGFGEFRNDPAPTPNEIELLAQWADGRAPLGAVLPPARVDPDTSLESGRSDIVLDVAPKYRIDEASHTFELATGLQDDRWIRGWEFEPGNSAFVTGAVVALPSGATLGSWTPGQPATFLPEGVAYRLPGRSPVLVTVYYRRPDGPAVDASRLGLYFTGRPRRQVEHMVLPCGSIRLPRAIEALAIRPLPGAGGRSLTVLARRPGRAVEPLTWFRNYPADHAQTYWFRDAVALPRGTSIEVAASEATCRAELDYVAAGEPVLYRAPRAPALESAGTVTEYWCPMHADVRATVRGVCGRCGMPLVPMTARVEGQYWLDATLLPARLRAGQPGTLRLVVREPGSAAIVREFETIHDRPFHLFVVSDDLQEFSHVHPVAMPDGSLDLPVTLRRPGAYRVYADFLPVGGTPQMIGKTVVVGASRPFPELQIRPLAPDLAGKTVQGLRVRMQLESELNAGDPSLISFALEDAVTGLPAADLQPYLGAWGHMFIVGADLADAVHSHPTTPLSAAGGPEVFFYQRFPRAGSYRLWVQFQRAGSVITVPFTVIVADRPTSAQPAAEGMTISRRRGGLSSRGGSSIA
jgi:hypothetical protein